TEMEPAAGVVVNLLGDGGGEADDVMVERFFEFALAGDEAGQVGEPLVGTGFHFGGVGLGDDALGGERLAGEQFNLQPEAELVFVGPDGPHLRSGITRNHGLMKKEKDGKVK